MTQLDERIREHIHHAYHHAPAIKGIMDDAGVTPDDIQGVADLPKIPVTSKDDLVELHEQNPPFGGFLAVDPADLPRIYISPGPIYDPNPYDETVVSGTIEAFKASGLGSGDRVINTFMYHLTPAGLLIDEVLQAAGCTVIPTGPGNTELQIKVITDLGVTGYCGTPSYLAIIYEKAEEMGIPPAQMPLQKAVFTAEPYPPSMRQQFEGEYGLQTVSVYGTADLGFVGYDAGEYHGFCIVDHVHMEIVDPESGQPVEPGETGEIVVTTFNRGYPLVRFGTGDLGSLAQQPECGTRQQLLGIYGRAGEAIKVRGMFLHPNQLGGAVAQFPEIKRAQAVITRPEHKDVVTLRVELNPGADPSRLPDKLKQFAQDAVRLRIDTVEIVDAIDPGQRTVLDERTWE